MPDLERDLRALAADVDWPATPDLAAVVAVRLPAAVAPASHRGPGRGARRRRVPRRLAVVLVALLVAVPATALALPAPRHAILDALGLRHVSVERRPRVPAGHDPRLGDRTPLAAVPRVAGFVPLVPARLGAPDRTYVLGQVVTLVYDREHLLLAQAGGRLEPDMLHKILSVDDTIRRVRVAGRRGVWLPAGHVYEWGDATGSLVRSGAALVWEARGRVLRLEGPRSLDAALAIAASAR